MPHTLWHTTQLFQATPHSMDPQIQIRLIFLLSAITLWPFLCTATGEVLVGSGRADATGPIAEVQMMGYAKLSQQTAGIHTRLYARAFIFGDLKNERKRFVLVNLDACMASQAVTLGVLSKLKDKYGDLYSAENLAISGIHTHAAPAGYLQYVVYQITSMGFVKQTYDAMVEGIVKAIVRAHESISPGKVFINQGDLLNASVSRSPTAYLKNPKEEREKYKHDTDKTMTHLRIEDDQGMPLGSLNWFAVHCTSLTNSNQFVSGDNKGVASLMMENYMRDSANSSAFVGAFAQSNVGDVSPNTEGAFCTTTEKPCDIASSTCNGKNEQCHGRGPGWPDEYASNKIIAQRQFSLAKTLQNDPGTELKAPIDYMHTYLDMSNLTVEKSKYGPGGKTCPPAMGYSFAAGTTDGPGDFDFTQGQTKGSRFWQFVSSFLKSPSQAQKDCHFPKPILLDTGEVQRPYAWQPSIVDLQLLRIGNLIIACVPGEFTTMSGRRLRESVHDKFLSVGGTDVQVVIAGLTNTYSSYITTFEEYQEQRYEGASTLFGPHTLEAYIQEFQNMAEAMVSNVSYRSGPLPPDLLSEQLSFVPGVYFDSTPIGQKFGSILQDVDKEMYCWGERVQATFRSANPRNNLRLEGTYLAVEQQHLNGSWTTYLTDKDYNTWLSWSKWNKLSPFSTAIVAWDIEPSTSSGTYRLRHLGSSKSLWGGRITEFEGVSNTFHVGGCCGHEKETSADHVILVQ